MWTLVIVLAFLLCVIYFINKTKQNSQFWNFTVLKWLYHHQNMKCAAFIIFHDAVSCSGVTHFCILLSLSKDFTVIVSISIQFTSSNSIFHKNVKVWIGKTVFKLSVTKCLKKIKMLLRKAEEFPLWILTTSLYKRCYWRKHNRKSFGLRVTQKKRKEKKRKLKVRIRCCNWMSSYEESEI